MRRMRLKNIYGLRLANATKYKHAVFISIILLPSQSYADDAGDVGDAGDAGDAGWLNKKIFSEN